MSLIHYFAKNGKINELRKKLRQNPEQLEAIDDNAWTPLFYAANALNKKSVRFLLNNGADTLWSDLYQRSVVEIAKFKGKHTTVSRYLKKKIGFTESEKEAIETAIKSILKTEHHKACSSNKKLLVLLGESHGVYKIYQIQKIILKLLVKQGILRICLEDDDVTTSLAPIDLFARKLAMKLYAIDKHPDRENVASSERDIIMAKELNQLARSCVAIVGAKHLKGLLERVDLNQYHVLPINLSSCVKNDYIDNSVESAFSYDKNNVIQLRGCVFTDSKKISSKWNRSGVNNKRTKAYESKSHLRKSI